MTLEVWRGGTTAGGTSLPGPVLTNFLRGWAPVGTRVPGRTRIQNQAPTPANPAPQERKLLEEMERKMTEQKLQDDKKKEEERKEKEEMVFNT